MSQMKIDKTNCDSIASENVKRTIQNRLKSLKAKKKTSRIKNTYRPLPPDSVARDYARGLKPLLAALKKATDQIIIPGISSILKEAESKRPNIDSLKADASYIDSILKLIGAASIKFYEDYTELEMLYLTRRVASNTNQFSEKEFKKTFKKVLGLDPLTTEPWLKQEMKAFTKANVALIKTIPENYFSQIEGIVTSGARSGYLTSEIAASIQSKFNVTKSRATFIARDQVSKFNGDLVKLRYQNVGINKYTWSTSGDERVRDSHAAKDGNVYSFDDPPSDTGNPGDDYQCIPDFATVSLHAPAIKAFRRWHNGELTKIISDSGEPLFTTPNHPILTTRGWIGAQFVKDSDYLIEAPDKRVNGFIQNPQSRNVTAKQIFCSMRQFGLFHRVAGITPWFHGDTTTENIEIIKLNRKLFFNNKASISKMIRQNSLTGAAKPTFGQSDLALRSVTNGDSPRSGISSSSQHASLSFGSSLHSQTHGSTFPSNGNAALKQNPSDWCPADIENLSDSFLANSILVHPDNFIFRKVNKVVRFPWNGWVHNFETLTGWFSSSNLIVHNCRCVAIALFEGE
jgi:SPP1 gp7 family putative phage head morphogenesis protein